jgi:glycerol-3-phosphate dehydrogenase
VIREIPAIKQKGLRGGIVYHDGQFDDARMAITLAQTAIDYGAVCINYMKVDNLLKNNGTVCGAVMTDQLTNEIYTIEAKSVINATGVFVDEIMKMVGQEAEKKIRPSQGVHLVVDSKFLGGDSALMIPKTKDGRVLFGVPWHGKVVLGTTDTPLDEASVEPRALDEEIDFILDQAGEYLDSKPTRKDVRSVFAGLRPLAASVKSNGQKTKEISRSHKIYKSPCVRLITITGGKWTTYREMAEDAVNQAVKNANLICRPCMTKELKQHGYTKNVDRNFWDYVYGSDVKYIKKLTEEDASNADLLYEGFTFTKAHVVWAVREEMAVTVEDILARRVRLLFLDAKAAMKVAPAVASIIAKETGKDKTWEEEQVKEFIALAEEYVLS